VQVTRRKKFVERERARLHSLGMLSAGLGHELRQPLQVVRTQVGNVQTRLTEIGVHDDEIAQSQEAIDRNIQRMHDSISYIGEIAMGDVDKVDDLDLAGHLKQDARFFSNQCRAKGIDLTLNVPDAQPARISQTGFSMVFLNLVTNAVEALDEKRRGRRKTHNCNTRREESNKRPRSNRQRPGISEQMRKNLFKEFETGKTRGMGIGLYTAA